MAFLVPKLFGQAAIGTGAGTLIYTAPTLVTALLKSVDICNTTAGTLTVSLYLVPLAGSAAAANALFYTVNVGAAGTTTAVYQWRGTAALNSGGFIQAIASGAGLTLNAAGGEYSK